MKSEGVCDSREIAKILGIDIQTARKVAREGLFAPVGRFGTSNIYAVEDVLRVKQKLFRDGYTHTKIAAMYGKPRGTVIYWFYQFGIERDGVDRRIRRAPNVYDKPKVDYVAEQLGWKLVENTPE